MHNLFAGESDGGWQKYLNMHEIWALMLRRGGW